MYNFFYLYNIFVNFTNAQLLALYSSPLCVSSSREKSQRMREFFFTKTHSKVMYGRLPDQFADYWMTRFPKLLIHSWMAMHCIKREPSLAKYFDKDYDFVKVSDLCCTVHTLLVFD